MVTKTFKKNPVAFDNAKVEALNDAYALFMEALNTYIKNNNISEKEVEEIKKLLVEAYNQKKASYFLENKLNPLNNYLNEAAVFALKGISSGKDSNPDYCDLYYYLKRTKHLITNE